MATAANSSILATRIEQLLLDRQEHVDAVAAIDETLASVGSVLGGMAPSRGNGRKPAAAPKAAAAPAGKRRRGRGHFALSAEESILAFVEANERPTTADVNAHFKKEGRSSSANNALGKLVREKKLKRTALGSGIRGSFYAIP